MGKRQRAKDLRLIRRVERELRRFGVRPGDGLVVGVSGGPDSVCLLHWLKAVCASLPLSLHVAHLDHGLRGEESSQDARFVLELGEKLAVPVTVETASVAALAKKGKVSVEVAAREARYAFFQRIADRIGGRWVVLGHTADDQAETFLQRLLRGAGALGLSGIPPVRRLGASDRTDRFVIRPLLGLRRREILDYLTFNSLPYRRDSSNLEDLYQRNRVRRELLPLMASRYNPDAVEALCRTAELLGEQERWLSACSVAALRGLEVRDPSSPGVVLMRRDFLGQPLALQRGVLREALARVCGGLQGLDFGHFEEVLELVRAGKAGSSVHLPKGLRVRMLYDRFCLFRSPPTSEKIPALDLPVPGVVALPSLGLAVKARVQAAFVQSDPRTRAAFNYERVGPSLALRGRRPGDYFLPLGLRGRRKKIHDFFVDRKIPRHVRDAVPLLASSGGILWVVGHQLDGRFIARPGDRKILVVELQRLGA